MVTDMMPKSVLLVDDSTDDQFLTQRILRKAGVDDIRVARNGRETLDILLAESEPLPDIVILDLRLPKVHGLKVFAEIRRNERTIALPVIVLTSSDDLNDRNSCLKLGTMAYLIKPLELSAFEGLFS
jgi:CheY-like chemotaxis protein